MELNLQLFFLNSKPIELPAIILRWDLLDTFQATTYYWAIEQFLVHHLFGIFTTYKWGVTQYRCTYYTYCYTSHTKNTKSTPSYVKST